LGFFTFSRLYFHPELCRPTRKFCLVVQLIPGLRKLQGWLNATTRFKDQTSTVYAAHTWVV